ncbi:unnamed protein product [Victoria cruziana]
MMIVRVFRSKRFGLSMGSFREFTSVSEEAPSAAAGRPPPIRVSTTEHAGRGVFATRRINSGELIHTAEALITHPALPLLDKVCYICLKRLLGPKQKEMPDGVASFLSSEPRLHRHNLANDLRVSFCSEKCYDTSKVNVEFQLLRGTFERSGVTDEQLSFLTREWYTNVLSRIRINSFRVELVGGISEDLLTSAAASISGEVSVGNAIYMIPSFYNHDCDPNAHIVWVDSSDARMKALSNIEPGEEIRICYIDASMDHEARQALLFNGFGFKCNCFRCLSRD